MRYIIDAALLQADLLNRTLVLPSFVYARACEYDMCVFLLNSNNSYTSTPRCHIAARFAQIMQLWLTGEMR